MIKLILRGVENYFKMAIFPTCRSTMNRTTQFDSITMYIVTMSKTNQSLRLTKKKKERKENQNLKKKITASSLDEYMLAPIRRHIFEEYDNYDRLINITAKKLDG